MRTAALTFVALIAFGSLRAQETDDSISAYQADEIAKSENAEGSLATIMNAFIRAYAMDVREWRTDIKLGVATADSVPPDGYQKAHAEIGGWYYFRPKTSDNLSIDQRRAIIRDKRFAPFVAQMRSLADHGVAPLDPSLLAAAKPEPASEVKGQIGRAELMSKLLAGRRGPPDTIYFEVSAEELVLPGRLLVTSNQIQTP